MAWSLVAKANREEKNASEGKNQGIQESASPILAIQSFIEKGKLEAAEKLLDQISDDSIVESYRGILFMKRNQPHEAIPHFQRVLRIKPNQTSVWLYLGQAYFHTGKYKKALQALENGQKIGKDFASYFQLKARVQMRIGDIEKAYETLLVARKRFVQNRELLREQALLLVNAGLYKAALEKGQQYLSQSPDDRGGYLIVAEALRRAGRPREAAQLLEEVALRNREDAEVLARLAFAYSEDRRTIAAARLFAFSTRIGGDYGLAASEHYRMAGRYGEASRMNIFIRDTKKRLSQRLAIYIGKEDFGRAIALTQPLRDADALDDTNRYCLAYAHLRFGNLDQAKELAQQVSDPKLRHNAQKILMQISRMETLVE